MTTVNNRNCPLSEEFFYWPPEEMAQYKDWCEADNLHHKRRLKKLTMTDSSINQTNGINTFRK